MNRLKNGTIAVGAPGSEARKRAEREDEMKSAGNPELVDYRIRGGLFFLYYQKSKTWRITTSMVPHIFPGTVLFETQDGPKAREFFQLALKQR